MLVPAGKFKFGKPGQMTDEQLPAFYIDKTEVTNKAYKLYARERGIPEPAAADDRPVVNVTVDDARKFCEWAGKRLPTAKEWEKAARGTDGRVFPWGDSPDESRVRQELLPADSLPEGKSPYEALNMAGNVWEFVSDTRFSKAEEVSAFKSRGRQSAKVRWPMVYGGSFQYVDIKNLESWDYAVVPPDHREKDLGFRCAKNPTLTR